MSIQLRKAERSKTKLKIGVSGPSGSGKTYSALLLARGMATSWDKIAIIDTENGSADLYCDLGSYNVVSLETFQPKDYIEAIKACEAAGMEVIVIDSITHEWTAAKDMVDKLGGRFQDWAKVTPIHDRFLQTILQSKCHVITTVRSKTDYAMSQEGGKTKVQKVGLKSETRDGFEYELTLSFDININHMAETSKDRTGMFMDADPFVISEETGRKLLDWANSGLDFAKIISELAPKKGKTVEGILTAYKVNSIDELTVGQLRSIIGRLNSLPDVKPEDKKPEEPKNPQPTTAQAVQAQAPAPQEPKQPSVQEAPKTAETEAKPAEVTNGGDMDDESFAAFAEKELAGEQSSDSIADDVFNALDGGSEKGQA